MNNLQTQRLILQPLQASDKPVYTALLGHPEVIRYCFDPLTAEQIEASFHDRLVPWGPNSTHWLCLAMSLKTDGGFVGVTGFVKNGTEADLGYMLLPEFSGRGLATESLQAVITFAKSQGVARLRANITEGNVASERVVKKCGFTLSRTHRNSLCINGTHFNDLEYTRNI